MDFTNIFQKIGGTKFVAFLVIVFTSTPLVYLGKIDGMQYCGLVGAVAGMFMGSNAIATFGNAKMETAKRGDPCP